MEITLLCHTLLICLGKEEIDKVVEIRTSVEVPFRGTGKEAQSAIGELPLIVLLDEPVLLVYDAVIGQYLYCLVPGRECIASYSAKVTVKSSGSPTRNATVMSAFLLTMQSCSTEYLLQMEQGFY